MEPSAENHPYSVGQILTMQDGTRQVITHIACTEGEYYVYTEILANKCRYYEVDAKTWKLTTPSYSRFNWDDRVAA